MRALSGWCPISVAPLDPCEMRSESKGAALVVVRSIGRTKGEVYRAMVYIDSTQSIIDYLIGLDQVV